MIEIDLKPLEEIIAARQLLHGGKRGAPKLTEDQKRQGDALNRAAMVTLAAALEAFIEDTFLACVNLAYPDYNDDSQKRLLRQLKVPRTTNSEQITSCFLVIGAHDILENLSWKKCSNETLRRKLKEINQIRNRCAHGQEIQVDGKKVVFNLAKVNGYKEFAKNFGARFYNHATKKFE